jgi:hypothetical protein
MVFWEILSKPMSVFLYLSKTQSMKRLFILCLITLLSAGQAQAQHWEIYRNGDSLLYYKSGHGYDPTAVFMKADSMLITGNDTTFVMNRKVVNVSSSTLHGNLPQLLQRRVIHLNNGDWNLSDTANWLLRPGDPLLSSWIFDANQNITASITRVYWGQVLGQNDSIKTISLSNGDSILVSKHYGIISFPPFLSGTSAYHLAGFNQSAADSIPGFFEVFTFQPGDILEYTSYNNNYNFNSSPSTPIYGSFRDSVISIQYTSSQVMINLYQWSHVTYFNHSFSADHVTRIISRSNYSFLDYQANNSFVTAPSYFYYYTPILMEFTNDSAFNCKTKNYFDYTLYGDNYDPLSYSNLIPPGVHDPDYTFGEGVGLIRLHARSWDPLLHYGHTYDSTLVGLKRNNVVYGALHDVSFFEEEGHPTASPGIYPNPATEFVYVNAEVPGTDARVQFYDVTGRLILEEQFITSIRLKMSDYSNGVYIIRVTQGTTINEYKLVHHAAE